MAMGSYESGEAELSIKGYELVPWENVNKDKARLSAMRFL